MTLTHEQLKAISPGTPDDRIATFLPHLNRFMPMYGIDTPIEIASYLAQVLHESGGFKWLRELWGPTAAQSRYEGRKDLGNIIKGDGKKFMGRGLIQLTGRANYERMSRELFGDNRLLHTPDLVSTPEFATQSACVFWKWKGLDAHDDDKDIKAETKRVNGGFNGLDDRQRYFNRACKVFGIA